MTLPRDWLMADELARSGRGRLTRGDAKGKFYIGHVIDHCNPPNARRHPEPWTCDCGREWVTVNTRNTFSGEPATWIPKDSLPAGWRAAYMEKS